MLKERLDALVNLNVEQAEKVRDDDDFVDQINRDIFERICEEIRRDPDNLEALINLMSASRHLERMADHATNIAEDVVYMVRGEIIRHHHGG